MTGDMIPLIKTSIGKSEVCLSKSVGMRQRKMERGRGCGRAARRGEDSTQTARLGCAEYAGKTLATHHTRGSATERKFIMNLSTFKNGAKAGFTLVELLVVILIIVILSVTMLPLLKPFVTKAQYAAEAVPVIGNLRTKVELYRIEKDHLPGIALDSTGKPVLKTVGALTNISFSVDYSSDAAVGVQSLMSVTNAVGVVGQVAWYNGTGIDPDSGSSSTWISTHVFNKIDVNYADLTGKRLRPDFFQYIVPYSKGEDFCWAIAVAGDGGTLPLGTAYAVLELNCSHAKAKFVATFERYKAEQTAQLILSTPNAATASGVNPISIPDVAEIFNATGDDATISGIVSGYKEKLRLAGWDVQ